MTTIVRNLTAALSLVALAACSTPGGSGTANGSRAKFIDEVWVSPELKGKSVAQLFSNVYFAPTTTRRLKEQGWWASQSMKTREELEVDAHRLAGYMHRSLISAARNQPGKTLHVVGHPGPDTLIVETAITELVPAKAFWNAAATAAGFAVPGASLLRMAGKGAIGFEGRLRDGNTGAVIAEFRHRAVDKSAALNVASYRWYGGSEASINEFSKKSAEVLNAPADKVVNRSAPFKLVAF